MSTRARVVAPARARRPVWMELARWAGLGLLAVVVVTIVVVAVLVVRIMWPRAESPATVGQADAVVVLAGATERLPAGVAAWDHGAAPVLVVSASVQDPAEDAGRMCARPEVVCFAPDPVQTRGEARQVAALARDRGWDHLAVVTSDYHVNRAELLFRQCYSGKVTMVGAETRLRRDLSRVRTEVLASVAGMTVRRAC